MSIQVQGVTVIDTSRQLSNITNLRTVGGQSILGTGDISANGSRAIVDYVFSGNPASGSGGDEIWSFTFSPDYVVADTTSGFSVSSTTLPSNQQWVGMDYGDGIWVAVANNTSTYAYSSDGVSWTQSTLPMSNLWGTISYSNGRWFIFPGEGATSSTWFVTSTDPVSSWQQYYTITLFYGAVTRVVKTNVIHNGTVWSVGLSQYSNENVMSSSDGITWNWDGTFQALGYGIANKMFYDSTHNYSLVLSSYAAPGSTVGFFYWYRQGNGSWIRTNSGTHISYDTKFVKIGQRLFFTGVAGGNQNFLRLRDITVAAGIPTVSDGSSDLNLTTTLLTAGENITDFEYLDNKFVILTDSNKLFYCISADGVTPSVLTSTNWVAVQLSTSTNWKSIVYGAADNKSVAIGGAVGTNFAQVFTGSPSETRYNLTLPAHGVYSTITNLVVRPPIGVTPTQQANLLGSTILASRPAYTIIYPSAGQVQVDTNSSGNIGDVILTMTAPPVSGSLNLVINPGGGTAQQDVITVTDPSNSQTYTYTGDLYATVNNISNSIAYYNTLTNWQMLPPISISTSSKLTLLAVNNGYVTTATMPTITITTGSNSTLAVTRFIRSFGN